MTNETTASQPKSIGDDAPFRNALSTWYRAKSGASRPQKVERDFAALIAAIDNFRAPAAQASATIQAAPTVSTITLTGHQLVEALDLLAPGLPRDPEELDGDLTFGVVQHEGDDGQPAIGMCCWNDDTDGVLPLDEHPTPAATIQEPVMVVEPVGDAFGRLRGLMLERRRVIVAGDQAAQQDVERQVIACITVLNATGKLAAPMVADPAGADGAARLVAYIEQLDARLVAAGFDHPQRMKIVGLLLDRDAALAATVKVVPSEALDEPDMLWLYDDGEVFANGPDEFANDYATDAMMAGDEVEVMVDCAYRAERRTMRIKVTVPDEDRKVSWEWVAAPLADNTGGGE